MPTALITLGRLPKALTLARLLRRAGYRVIVAEPFRWHIGRVSRAIDRCYTTPAPNSDAIAYRETLLQIIARECVSLVVPVSEEIHHVLPLRQSLPSEIRILGPLWDDYQTCADKLLFVRHAKALGLRTPTTYLLDTPEAAALASHTQCIYKPRRGCSGLGVTQNAGEAREENGSQGVIAQAFVAGRVVSSLSLMRAGRIVNSVVYEGKTYAGSVAICFERISPTPDVAAWITTWCESFNFDGFIALDLIIDSEGNPWGIECNPRLTSGIHFFNSINAVCGEVPAATGDLPPEQNAAEVRRWQWAYSTLTEAYSELFHGRPGGFLRNMRLLLSSRDCVWSMRDPLPFLLMTPLSAPILWPAIVEGVSMGEACQRDIAPLWDPSANRGVVDNDS